MSAFKRSSVPRPVDPRKEQDEFHFCYTFQEGLLQQGKESTRWGKGAAINIPLVMDSIVRSKFIGVSTTNSLALFWGSTYLRCTHRTTRGLLYPRKMIDLSHLYPRPLGMHNKHRQDSRQWGDCSFLKPALSHSEKENNNIGMDAYLVWLLCKWIFYKKKKKRRLLINFLNYYFPHEQQNT